MRFLFRNLPGWFVAAIILAFSLSFIGCETTGGLSGEKEKNLEKNLKAFQIGDKARIEITGTSKPMFSEELEVKDDGAITVTDVGPIDAAGKTVSALEKEIHEKLVPSHYAKAVISIVLLSPEVLRIGDKVRVEINGTPTLIQPSEQEVKGDGTITVINIGQVKAEGKTPARLEREVRDQLIPGYFTKCTVTIIPMNNRYFTVGGEVIRGDRYLYSGTITLTRAIQTAGGFTPYADRKRILLIRPGEEKPREYDYKKLLNHPDKDPLIYPGDDIEVQHRII